MAVTCSCTNPIGNTGTDCSPSFKAVARAFAMGMIADDGTANALTVASINEAAFTAAINHVDPSKRLYPLPLLKNVSTPRAASTTFEWEDGEKEFVKEGVKQLIGSIPNKETSTMILGQLKKLRCAKVGLFLVDVDGSIRGTISSDDTLLYPTEISGPSLDVILNGASGTKNETIDLTVDFASTEFDENLAMITAEELGGSYLLKVNGLRDVTMVVSDISQTGAIVKMKTLYGTPANRKLLKGLVTADFVSSVGGTTSKVYNVTDSAALTVTVTEDTAGGTYTLAWASQDVSDVIEIKVIKAGYSFTVTNLTIV